MNSKCLFVVLPFGLSSQIMNMMLIIFVPSRNQLSGVKVITLTVKNVEFLKRSSDHHSTSSDCPTHKGVRVTDFDYKKFNNKNLKWSML